MKTFRTIVKRYDVPLYGSKLVLIIYKSINPVNKALAKEGSSTKMALDEAGCYFTEVINDRRTHFIVLQQDTIKELQSTLVHELFHLVQDILEHREIQFVKGGSNEPYAYLYAALYSMIIEDIK